MWTNIWEALKLLVSYGDRLSQLEKESRESREEQKDLFKQMIALTLKVERLAERENWRDEMLRREFDLERAKAENERHKAATEQAKAETARLRSELERRSLPPSSTETKDDQS